MLCLKKLETMLVFLFILLVGYAVRCDDNNYYVIELPAEDPMRGSRKPLKVYWNVPTMQCRSKKIPFENLYEKYGILQNKNDSFQGEKITILYDPGLFPAILKNDSSGNLKFRNGGVPQEGDLAEHLERFRQDMDKSIPNHDFSGIGIIDFESWRPIFRQNFGVLVPYKDTSFEIERKIHWWWPDQWIKSEAKRRFESSAREFMQTTLSVAKQVRPNALWGYYAFPYCFNMAKNGLHEACANGVPAENDKLYWLWSESSALFPSLYSSRQLSSNQLAGLVRGRLAEARRTRRAGSPLLPYYWFRYREGGYFSEADLKTVLHTLYTSGATGFVIWGSSNDVNTKEKCVKLLKYVDTILGPNIAKYTKANTILHDEESEVDTNVKEKTTTENTNDVEIDPEYHWVPPVNYTNNIKENVEQEIKKKHSSSSQSDKFPSNIYQKGNESTLLTLLLNTIEKGDNISSDIVERQRDDKISIEASHNTDENVYSKNSKKGYPITDHGIEGFVYSTQGPYLFSETTSNSIILSTKDYLNKNLHSTTKDTNYFTDKYSVITTTGNPTTLRTEGPKFDGNSSIDTKTQINKDITVSVESADITTEMEYSINTQTTESLTESEESFTTESVDTIPLEDILDNKQNYTQYYNHNTFYKDSQISDSTETTTEFTSVNIEDVSIDSTYTDSTLTQSSINSKDTDENFTEVGTTDNIENSTDNIESNITYSTYHTTDKTDIESDFTDSTVEIDTEGNSTDSTDDVETGENITNSTDEIETEVNNTDSEYTDDNTTDTNLRTEIYSVDSEENILEDIATDTNQVVVI